MKDEQLPLRPARPPRYRDLKDALRKNVWGNKKDAGYIAADARIDPSVLSRWMSDNPDDNAGKWVNKFIPLLIAMGEGGLDLYNYIGEELRAAQDKASERDTADAATMICEFGKGFPAILRAAEIIIASQKAKK
jgi:hypothetical protein